MFDVGFSEVVIIAIIALVILGPERLPKVARTLGFWVGKARRMVADVKSDIDREMRESELTDLRKLGDEISEVKNEVQSAAGEVADDTGVESVVESIKRSADDIQSSVSDVTATDDLTQSAESESLMDDSTDISLNKDKQIPTS